MKIDYLPEWLLGSVVDAPQDYPDLDLLKISSYITVVCIRFPRLNRTVILSTQKSPALSEARQIGMYLAREHSGKSFPEIGRGFGGRDHTTVLYGCRKIEARLEAGDVVIAKHIAACREILGITK